MISINDIRTSPQKVEEALNTKGYEGSISDIVSIDENFRKLTHSLETSRAKKNLVSEEVAKAKSILKAMEEAQKQGKGAASLDGRLIDLASVRQATVMVQKAELINKK